MLFLSPIPLHLLFLPPGRLFPVLCPIAKLSWPADSSQFQMSSVKFSVKFFLKAVPPYLHLI